METTRVSLLIRVRDRSDSLAWGEFAALYRPIIMRYAHKRGLGRDDAEDLAQSCLATIAEKIASFEYDPRRGRFRAWLRTIVNNRIQNMLARHCERTAESGELRRPQACERSPDEIWEQICLEEHLKHALEQVRPQVEPKTFEAFRLVVLEERPVEQVCKLVDMTANQVYVARSRVTQRLRETMAELFDENE